MNLRVFFPKICNLTPPPTIRHKRVLAMKVLREHIIKHTFQDFLNPVCGFIIGFNAFSSPDPYMKTKYTNTLAITHL